MQSSQGYMASPPAVNGVTVHCSEFQQKKKTHLIGCNSIICLFVKMRHNIIFLFAES